MGELDEDSQTFEQFMEGFMSTFSKILGVTALGAVLSVTPLRAEVKTDYDHKVTFSSYHTYSWHKVQTSDPLFEQRVRDAVDKDLSARGWQRVETGGDVAVTAVGTTKDQKEYSSFYDGIGGGGGFGWRRGWGGGGFGETTTTVNDIPVGMLIVDLYDRTSKQLIFRGTASDDLSKNPDKNTAKLDKDIDKMFAKFPPKGAQ